MKIRVLELVLKEIDDKEIKSVSKIINTEAIDNYKISADEFGFILTNTYDDLIYKLNNS